MLRISFQRGLLFYLLFFSLVFTSSSFADEPKFSVKVAFDRASQIYKCGEEADISISVLDPKGALVPKGELALRFTNDGLTILGKKTVDLSKSNPYVVKKTMELPGFLYFDGTAQIPEEVVSPGGASSAGAADSGKGSIAKCVFQAAAAFDPEKIEPGMPHPSDFDEFIGQGKKEVRAIPIDAKMEKISSTEKAVTYSVSFATIGDRRIHGFLTIPKGKGPFPAYVFIPGAGCGTGPAISQTDGFVTLVMNVFPYPVSVDAKERNAQFVKFSPPHTPRFYWLDGAEDRNSYFFRSVFLGMDRAIDWLAMRPEVDPERLGCFGTSQGGGGTLILAGMNSHIKACVSSIPALCDHSGGLKGRQPGWPNLAKHFDKDAKVLDAARYLDAVNFAYRIECPIRMTVGFIDRVCSPSSVYSAFNVIPSKDKKMLTEVNLGHRNGEQFQVARRWLCNYLLNLKSKTPASPAGTNPAIGEASRATSVRYADQVAQMNQGNVDLLMVGDSITHGWDKVGKAVWDQYYSNRNAMNFGSSGDQTQHVLWRLAHSPLDKISPKMAVVNIGTNNIGSLDRCTPEQTIEGIQKVVSVLREKFPKMKILLMEIFPRDEQPTTDRRARVNKVNEALRKIYKNEENVQLYGIGDLFLDENGVLRKSLMPDFLHPNAEGYKIWARAIEPMIVETLGPAPKESNGVPVRRESWLKRFEEVNQLLQKGDVDLLMVGDSITHGWERSGKYIWKKYYGKRRAINLGIGGDRTEHVIWRLNHYDFSKVDPRGAVLLIGVNNLADNCKAADIAMSTRIIVKNMHEKFPKMKIIVLKVFPWGEPNKAFKMKRVNELNELLPYYVRDLDYVKLVDINKEFLNANNAIRPELMPDYLHPNAQGYERWGAALEKDIATMVP